MFSFCASVDSETGMAVLIIHDFFLLLFKGEAEFYESPPLHGTNSCCVPAPCNPFDGGKCGWHHIGTCKKRH